MVARVPGRKSRRMPCIPLVKYREILPRKWTASTVLCWKIIVHTDVSIHAWKCISKRGSVPAAVCDTFLHFQAPRTSRIGTTQSFSLAFFPFFRLPLFHFREFVSKSYPILGSIRSIFRELAQVKEKRKFARTKNKYLGRILANIVKVAITTD